MMNSEIEVGGRRYRLGKINALQQFHVMRRLAPVMAAVGLSLSAVKEKIDEPLPGDFLTALGPVAHVLAQMSDEDTDYILATCLGVVSRFQPETNVWAPVSNGRAFMFEDIGMQEMIRLTIGVIQSNMADFFKDMAALSPSALSSPSGTAPEPATKA